MVPPREGNEARGDGRRGIGVPHTTAEAGESSPRDPVEGRGRRQVVPLEGQTANSPRLDSVSTQRQRIAEWASHGTVNLGETTRFSLLEPEFLRSVSRRTSRHPIQPTLAPEASGGAPTAADVGRPGRDSVRAHAPPRLCLAPPMSWPKQFRKLRQSASTAGKQREAGEA